MLNILYKYFSANSLTYIDSSCSKNVLYKGSNSLSVISFPNMLQIS